MSRAVICPVLAGLAVVSLMLVFGNMAAAEGEAKPMMLAHDVYFTLNDDTPDAREKLIASCNKYLTGHPGTVWFAAGPLAEELNRDVNDLDFDVALHLVFKDIAAHDAYQTHERHLKFIEENKETWAKVRVFDSFVPVFSHGEVVMTPDRPKQPGKPAPPDPAAGFAGMIEGVVVKVGDGEAAVRVEKVVKVWRTNKAKEPASLVGQTVAVDAPRIEGRPAAAIAKFLSSLKPEEKVTLDVANRSGEALTVLELTEEQRARAGR